MVVEIGNKKYIANAHYKKHKGTYAVIDLKAKKDNKYVTYRLRKEPAAATQKATKTSSSSSSSASNSSSYVEYYFAKNVTTAEAAKLTNILNKEIVKDVSNLKKIYSDYKSSVTSDSIFNS